MITGGTGFVGSALTKRLVNEGHDVVVFDNNLRGQTRRLDPVIDKITFIEGDVTNYESVLSAMDGIQTVFHLAYINGTDNFYNFPEQVLEVGVKGALTTLDASIELGVENYIVTSSSEVYQQPTHFPTTEKERIIIPDVNNPRFSYSGGKIITELLTIHYAAKTDLNTIICRPHNFYGPDMGMGHVIPQFINRMLDLSNNLEIREINFPIQGTGKETRAFCYIDDAIDGVILASLNGEKGEIYHIGTQEEISIIDLAYNIGDKLGLKLNLEFGELLAGSTDRRCPSIKKISTLGYQPKYNISRGLDQTVGWYIDYLRLNESSALASREGLIK